MFIEEILAHLFTTSVIKYHQVKRMIAAIGNRVETLHREQFAGMLLPADLAVGSWRWLSPDELKPLEQQ